MEDVDLEQLKTLPFQVQITYTALDGSKCVKVISKELEIGTDREEVEKEANYEMLGQHCIQQSAKIAQKGDVREAQAYAKNWNRKMRSNKTSDRDVLLMNMQSCYQDMGAINKQQIQGNKMNSDA